MKTYSRVPLADLRPQRTTQQRIAINGLWVALGAVLGVAFMWLIWAASSL